jgi:hypothetical protein
MVSQAVDSPWPEEADVMAKLRNSRGVCHPKSQRPQRQRAIHDFLMIHSGRRMQDDSNTIASNCVLLLQRRLQMVKGTSCSCRMDCWIYLATPRLGAYELQDHTMKSERIQQGKAS